ncbi:hypothetical protein Hanom_Chr12g01166741 [Helianthus anomalus]
MFTNCSVNVRFVYNPKSAINNHSKLTRNCSKNSPSEPPICFPPINTLGTVL